MLPKEQLLRLGIEQEKSLLKSESKLDQLKRFKSDYQRVSKQLQTLPDKLEYPMMIPLGKKAFIPGRLISTNEILVLLGDNWFVECTAKNARKIAERRIKQVDESIEEASKARESISDSLKFTKEFGENSDGNRDFEEIIEFESESGEITTLKGPNLTDRTGKEEKTKKERDKALLDFEARLTELQRAEESLDEENGRRSQPELIEDSPIDESIFQNEIMKMPSYTSTIQFHHTKSNTEKEVSPERLETQKLSSPADIYNSSPDRMRKYEHFEEETQSKRKVRWADNNEKIREKQTPPLRDVDVQAFTKVVRERNPSSPANSGTDMPQESRKISKFKLAKMK